MVVLSEIKTFFTALANHLVGFGRQGGVGGGTLVLLLTVRMKVLVALLGNVAGTVAVGLW